MSHYNNNNNNSNNYNNNYHSRNNNIHNNNYPDNAEYEDVYDYGNSVSSTYPLEQRLTPQQQRQEERRRHAEQASSPTSVNAAAAAAAAAAGKGSSPWLNKQRKKSNKCKTIAWATGILLVVAVAGVLAWYFAVYKKNQGNSNKNNGRIPATGPTVVAPNGTVIPNTNYPLKKVFYGMAYVPLNAQLPNCYNTQASVDEELKLVAQTTTRVRLYGTDCNVLRYTLDSIQRLKLDLKVVVGIWIDRENATFTRQSAEFFNVVGTYGWNNIIGVSVGNEVIFDKYQPLSVLMEHIKEVKAKVVAMGQPNIPVFTSDLEEANQPPLTTGNNEDLAGVNLHPFFAGVPVTDAASWYWKYYRETVEPTINKDNGAKKLPIWVTEVGWPTFPANAIKQASVPSIPNLQTFLDTWLCDANTRGIPYYYFEFFDAPWKIYPGSAVEGFWGLLTIDKKLKVKLPDCVIA